jgi:hypothetical protein
MTAGLSSALGHRSRYLPSPLTAERLAEKFNEARLKSCLEFFHGFRKVKTSGTANIP